MRHRLVFTNLLLAALFLALAPTALASSKWYVDGVNGSDNNDCKSPQTACKTIGHAISLAHAGDSIMVAATTYTENLTIGTSLKIVGSGAKTTIIDGGGVNTVVAIVSHGVHVTLSRVTIRNGFYVYGGGGILNLGTLTINNSTVSGNVAMVGGGIDNYGGTVTINNSTLSGNRSGIDRDGGGGIVNDGGTLTINNSTLSGNVAAGNGIGGGILNLGTLTINNSTVSGNVAGHGGGIDNNSGTTTLQNSIVANNSGGNCDGTMTSNGYNLSSDGTCNFNGTGDLNNTDPKLGQLGNYGGPTQTLPLLSGSPAIDAGNPSGCTDGQGHLLKTDQRGRPRPDKEDTGGCDMGAYERQKD
ncbi:MAG TPA: choice-of-anchor Q domain-containing protein [Terriglobales bacterium]|nr:choice-of-anchor Q domain-containing protein [Terriglobales bacterium]